MKKIKKSLTNNLLRLNVKDSYFVIKSNLQKKIDLEAKTLTSNTIYQTGINRVVDVSSLKFPMTLKTFKTLKDLKDDLMRTEKNCPENDLVVVKHNNLFFKNRVSDTILVKQDTKQVFIRFRSLTSEIVDLLRLLRFKQKASF